MPYTACPHGRCCSRTLALVIARPRLTARYRCCPLMSPASCPKHAPGASGHESLELRSKRCSGDRSQSSYRGLGVIPTAAVRSVPAGVGKSGEQAVSIRPQPSTGDRPVHGWLLGPSHGATDEVDTATRHATEGGAAGGAIVTHVARDYRNPSGRRWFRSTAKATRATAATSITKVSPRRRALKRWMAIGLGRSGSSPRNSACRSRP
jgi:hypothetical protein